MKWFSTLSILTALSVLYAILRRRMFVHYELEPNAIALITGGSGGLGRALAKCFAQAHCAVVVTGRNEQALREVVSECTTAGAASSHYIVADITTPAGTQLIADKVHEIFGNKSTVKYLVLSAGTGAIVPFSSQPSFHDICHEMMEINYFPNVRLVQLFLPELAQTHSRTNPSRIIVISSLAGILPSIQRAPYTAAKHALQGFMTALRGETDVKVTICCPDYVDTEFHRRVRTSAETGSRAHNNKRGITAMECAQSCINGALRNKLDVMPIQGWLGYIFRPWATSLVEYIAKRKSLRSLEHKAKEAPYSTTI